MWSKERKRKVKTLIFYFFIIPYRVRHDSPAEREAVRGTGTRQPSASEEARRHPEEARCLSQPKHGHLGPKTRPASTHRKYSFESKDYNEFLA